METLRRGDCITIHFSGQDCPRGYALCIYSGKRGGRHYFISETYGWRYIVDLKAGTVVCDYSPEKVYEIDDATGWVKYLPGVRSGWEAVQYVSGARERQRRDADKGE